MKSKFNTTIKVRDIKELQSVLDVIHPSKKIRESQEHKERVATAKKVFANMSFKIKWSWYNYGSYRIYIIWALCSRQDTGGIPRVFFCSIKNV